MHSSPFPQVVSRKVEIERRKKLGEQGWSYPSVLKPAKELLFYLILQHFPSYLCFLQAFPCNPKLICQFWPKFSEAWHQICRKKKKNNNNKNDKNFTRSLAVKKWNLLGFRALTFWVWVLLSPAKVKNFFPHPGPGKVKDPNSVI